MQESPRRDMMRLAIVACGYYGRDMCANNAWNGLAFTSPPKLLTLYMAYWLCRPFRAIRTLEAFRAYVCACTSTQATQVNIAHQNGGAAGYMAALRAVLSPLSRPIISRFQVKLRMILAPAAEVSVDQVSPSGSTACNRGVIKCTVALCGPPVRCAPRPPTKARCCTLRVARGAPGRCYRVRGTRCISFRTL